MIDSYKWQLPLFLSTVFLPILILEAGLGFKDNVGSRKYESPGMEILRHLVVKMMFQLQYLLLCNKTSIASQGVFLLAITCEIYVANLMSKIKKSTI